MRVGKAKVYFVIEGRVEETRDRHNFFTLVTSKGQKLNCYLPNCERINFTLPEEGKEKCYKAWRLNLPGEKGYTYTVIEELKPVEDDPEGRIKRLLIVLENRILAGGKGRNVMGVEFVDQETKATITDTFRIRANAHYVGIGGVMYLHYDIKRLICGKLVDRKK